MSNSAFFIQEMLRAETWRRTHVEGIAAYLFDLIGMIQRSIDRSVVCTVFMDSLFSFVMTIISDDANGQLEEEVKMDNSNAQLYKLPRNGR